MAGERGILPLLVFWAALTLFSELAWYLPVRCNLAGCNGLMKKTGTRAIDWKSKLVYQCTVCKGVYLTDVYHPPFRIH
jgi:hypothetical protein